MKKLWFEYIKIGDSMFGFGIPEIMVIVVIVAAIGLVILGIRFVKNLFKKNENWLQLSTGRGRVVFLGMLP